MLAASLALVAGFVAADPITDDRSESPVAGFIWGTVETRSGDAYTGTLRWDDEESFWDDHFNASKAELPYAKLAEKRKPDDDATWWQRMVKTIGDDLGLHRIGRVVTVRFGDLAGLRTSRGDDVVLILRDGTELEVDDSSNDLGSPVIVEDPDVGLVEVPWRQVAKVTFGPTPDLARSGVFRLHGTVSTRTGDLAGWVQWDSQECLSTDILDGDSEGSRVKLEMGKIRTIERRNSRSAVVTLKDGTSLELSGTNDVNDDIRGILVEDPRYGRVEVPWKQFVKVVFDDPDGSGRGFAEFSHIRHLEGTVTTSSGQRLVGRLVFDLDEEWSWEMLDGTASELDYSIPFVLVASVEPAGRRGAVVHLRGGGSLTLEDSHDVDPDNDGVAVLSGAGGEPKVVRWREIERIDLD
jgi:hypothetical protein